MTPEVHQLLTRARALQPDKTRFTAAEMLTVFEHLSEVERLAQARLDLLRLHHGYHLHEAGENLLFAMPDAKVEPCENKQKYQTDCGKCLRCQSISSGMPDLAALRL